MLGIHYLLHLISAIQSVLPIFFALGTDVLSVWYRRARLGYRDVWQPGSLPTLVAAVRRSHGARLLQETHSLHYLQGLEHLEHLVQATQLKGLVPRRHAYG